MKIAVYSIALNEAKNVADWAESARGADLILLADTGSTDETAEIARKLGITVIDIRVSPWRFDDARNAALAAIPLDFDFCISLDLDERLAPGWREELEKLEGTGVTRPRYNYVWNWNPDGTPGYQFTADKIHARTGYRWRHPVHEGLVPNQSEDIHGMTTIEIRQYPDLHKSRNHYLPLLKQSTIETPYDDRQAFFYARELYFHGALAEAGDEFRRHLALPTATWNVERAASLRFLAYCEPEEAVNYLMQSFATASRRESARDMAHHFLKLKEWTKAIHWVNLGLAITERPNDYLSEPSAWNGELEAIGAQAHHAIGEVANARELAMKAITLDASHRELLSGLLSD